MKLYYVRGLPGGYYITMTPGVWLTEEDVLHGDRWRHDMDVQLAVNRVWTQPGMKLNFPVNTHKDLALKLPGGEEQMEKIRSDWREKGKLLPLEQPMLALTRRLMGWKLIRLSFPEKRPVSAVFFDTLSSRMIELEIVDESTGETPIFRLDTMGENGMTQYEYCGLRDGKPVIWEQSSKHERLVTIIGADKCMVDETVAELGE